MQFKKHSRFLGISSGKVDFNEETPVPVVGILWRNPFIDNFYIDYANIDSPPSEITELLMTLIPQSLFSSHHIKAAMISNTILAGLSLIDINQLYQTWGVPLLFITEKEPKNEKIIEIAKNKDFVEEFFYVLDQNPSNWTEVPGTRIFILPVGINDQDSIQLINLFQLIGHLPEPLRLAKLLASSLSINL